jgi:site-specific recombinase XerD
MNTISRIDQGTISLLDQAKFLTIARNAFLVDRKAQNMSAGTLHFYMVKLKSFSEFCESQVITRIDQLTPDIIRQYLFHLEQTGHNPGGIHAFYRTLRTFLYWWEEEYEPDNWKNPIRKVKAPRVPQEPLQPIEREDFDSLLACCDKSWHGVRDRAILLTLLDSGVRAAELCNLNAKDLDLILGALEVRQGKGRKPRVTFIGAQARRAIRQWLKGRGIGAGAALFITREGERLTYWGLRQIVRRRAEQAGIEEPGLHDFRRAFCLAQLQAGVPETTIARLMGHTSTQLISRYAQQTAGDIRLLYHSPADETS